MSKTQNDAKTSEPKADLKEASQSGGVAENPGRRKFATGVATLVGAAGLIGAAQSVQAQDTKSKVLSRIQEELRKDETEDPMAYDKGTHDRYLKA